MKNVLVESLTGGTGMSTLFNGIFDSTTTTAATTAVTTGSVAVGSFLLCILVALVIGFILAAVYKYKNNYTKSFLLTLIILPAIVCVVIMMVNGNIGAGIAVAGAFSLVRFRSVPGNAREITTIFMAMGAGMVCGMGYLGYAMLFTLIMAFLMFIFTVLNLGDESENGIKILSVTIPENLDFNGVFEDLFSKYTDTHKEISVKTVNMGSLYRLKYEIKMKNASEERNFIDDIRTRNGNLEVSILKKESEMQEL